MESIIKVNIKNLYLQLIIQISLSFLCCHAFSEETPESDKQIIVMFEDGVPFQNFPTERNTNYFDSLVGARVRFSNGNVFTLGKILGRGNNNVIFENARDSESAIRIPLTRESLWHINSTVEGYDLLSDKSISTVAVYDWLHNEYVNVERVHNFISFFDLAIPYYLKESAHDDLAQYGISKKSEVSEDLRSVMEEAFLKFAQSLTAFEEIGDFIFEQLVFDLDQMRWVLLDWNHKHVLNENASNGRHAIFQPFEFIGMLTKRSKKGIVSNPCDGDRNLITDSFLNFCKRIWDSVQQERDQSIKNLNDNALTNINSCSDLLSSRAL